MKYKKQYEQLCLDYTKLIDENSNLKNNIFKLQNKINQLTYDNSTLKYRKDVNDILYKKIVEISDLPSNIENLRLFYDFIKIYKGIS